MQVADPLNQNLAAPLGADEVLPQVKAYARATSTYSGLRAGQAGGTYLYHTGASGRHPVP